MSTLLSCLLSAIVVSSLISFYDFELYIWMALSVLFTFIPSSSLSKSLHSNSYCSCLKKRIFDLTEWFYTTEQSNLFQPEPFNLFFIQVRYETPNVWWAIVHSRTAYREYFSVIFPWTFYSGNFSIKFFPWNFFLKLFLLNPFGIFSRINKFGPIFIRNSMFFGNFTRFNHFSGKILFNLIIS